MNTTDFIPFSLFMMVLFIAVMTDLKSRRIPNWLTLPTMIAAVSYHTITKGMGGFFFSLEGVGLGIAVLIIPWLMGGMGAGDAKLMGAIGGVLGPKGLFVAFLFSAVIGGFYAFILLILNGSLKETIGRHLAVLKMFMLTREITYVPCRERGDKLRLCYGIAIASGTTLFLLAFSG